MQLTAEQITKFQELYKVHLGKEISREYAYESCVKLVRLMELVYKPMTQEEYDRFFVSDEERTALLKEPRILY
jgi:hypothetical protein